MVEPPAKDPGRNSNDRNIGDNILTATSASISSIPQINGDGNAANNAESIEMDR
jgi:hypothetical protein